MRLEKGFTLIELMIVVAIIGILSMMALPAYQDYTRKTYVAEGLALASVLTNAVVEHYSMTGKWAENNAAVGMLATSAYTGQGVWGVTIGHGPSGLFGDGRQETKAAENKVSNVRIFYNEKVTGNNIKDFKEDENDPNKSPWAHTNSLTLAPVTNNAGQVEGSFQWVCLMPQNKATHNTGDMDLKWLPSNCRFQAYVNGPASH